MAAPALSGLEGGVELPGWGVQEPGRLRLTLAQVGGPASMLFPPRPNRLYAATMVVVPGLEVHARFTEAVGVPDPTIALPNYVDRMLSVKWAPRLPEGLPPVAVGLLDAFSINEINRLEGMEPGSSSFGKGAFLVSGGVWSGVRISSGILLPRLSGPQPYAQAEIPLPASITLCLEGTGRGVSWALVQGGWAWGRLMVAGLSGRDWGLSTSWDVAL